MTSLTRGFAMAVLASGLLTVPLRAEDITARALVITQP